MAEKNPLEQLPSSRGGNEELPNRDGGEYKEVVDEQFKDDNDGFYRNQYRKEANVEEIPDEDSLLPDQFEDKESDKDSDRDAYVDKYNKEHEDQYRLKRTYKKFGKLTQHAQVTYKTMPNGRLKPITQDTKVNPDSSRPGSTTVRKVA